VAGRLNFSAVEEGRSIEVRRDADVADDFWRRVRAEWGQNGEDPSSAIVVPLELFAGRQAWLPRACRQHGVSVELEDDVRAVVQRGRADRNDLSIAQANGGDLTRLPTQLESSRFVRELRSFQMRDASEQMSISHGANFSVPGAGKTTVQLAVYEAERTSGRVQQMLVVAPLSAFGAWVEDSSACLDPAPEVYRFAGGWIPPSAEIVLVNYQRLRSSFLELLRWTRARPTLVVLDEAHRMKRGHDGEWGAACLDLAHFATRRDILTGTPAPQHPSDLVALFGYLWPGQAQRILPDAAFEASPTLEQVAAVSPAIGPLFVRTTKDELGLREPSKHIVLVPLGGIHREIYESLRAQFSPLVRTQRDRVDLRSLGEVLMYMLEAATNPALLPAGSSATDPIEFRHPPLEIPVDSGLVDLLQNYAQYETPAKFIQLAAIVADLQRAGRKVLIWSNFIRNLETLERMLAAYEPAIVHGGIPSEISQPGADRVRETELARFRTDPNCGVLLANPAAMGEGVSLHHECHDAIYLERTFNAGQYLQSVDRIHRLGLAPDVETNITFLVTEGTVDEIVASRIAEKATNLGLMLDDAGIATMSLPDDEDVGPPLDVGSEADIEALFAHLRGG
jgi:hypothetical protein